MGAADRGHAEHRTPTAPARTGRRPKYVDWVGTDFYSKFPNFTDLETFYDDFPTKPFVFGEWALWDGDDPAFVHRFFDWVNGHKRVRMLLYNQGNLTERAVPAHPLPGEPQGDQAGAQEVTLPRPPVGARQPSMWSSTSPVACISA